MRVTLNERLGMVLEHLHEGKSYSYLGKKYQFDIPKIKYMVKLYLLHGDAPFQDRSKLTHRRDTKLLAISRVEKGESIRAVAADFGLLDPGILTDWIALYRKKGEAAIQDTNARRNYRNEDERYKEAIDQELKEKVTRLEAEIAYLKKSQSLALNLESLTAKRKSKIITELRNQYSLEVLLDITKIPASVYHYHQQVKPKHFNYDRMSEKIQELHVKKHFRKAGYQRIYIELKKLGYTIGKNKVRYLMGQLGFLQSKAKKWRRYHSFKGDLGGILPNVINQDFQTTGPYQKAGTDVTMFPLDEQEVFISHLIDFHTREVLAYAVGTDAKTDKMMAMLTMLKKQHGTSIKGMMIQSDQGSQYQSSHYRERLKSYKLIQSMSRRGNCLDNSPTESFFGQMKQEMWYGKEQNYQTPEQLILAIHEHIAYHNQTRIVTKLKSSPIAYRESLKNTQSM